MIKYEILFNAPAFISLCYSHCTGSSNAKRKRWVVTDQIYIPKFAGRLPPGSESRLRAGVQQGSAYPGHADYTLYNKGFVTNNRSMDHAFGDVRIYVQLFQSIVQCGFLSQNKGPFNIVGDQYVI